VPRRADPAEHAGLYRSLLHAIFAVVDTESLASPVCRDRTPIDEQERRSGPSSTHSSRQPPPLYQ
jgi:hypothetical protein